MAVLALGWRARNAARSGAISSAGSADRRHGSTRVIVAMARYPFATEETGATHSVIGHQGDDVVAGQTPPAVQEPVLELVLLLLHLPRQLAHLADRGEAGAEPVGDGGGDDEAAGLDAEYPVDR